MPTPRWVSSTTWPTPGLAMAVVTVPGLQAGTRIVAGHLVPAGTPGPVYADPAEYDVPRERAVIRSTSGSDQSRVAWIAGTEG